MSSVSDVTQPAVDSVSGTTGFRVWIDIDNPAQVQYLQRLQAAFTKLGADVLMTARASGMTTQFLKTYAMKARIVGGDLGKGKLSKAVGTIERAAQLWAILRSAGSIAMAVSTSRAAAIASSWLGLNHFVLLDYEYVDLSIYRLTGSWILHPDVIPTEVFVQRGLPNHKLIPFRGMKEDLTFSNVDVTQHRDANAGDRLLHVLVRPPSEKSHYSVYGSTSVTHQILDRLSTRPDVRVHFSPRHISQREYLTGRIWAVEPILYERPVPFLELLLRADAVVSAGGTMLREAAYLGIPAFSTFQGKPGAVDVNLSSVGRLVFIKEAREFDVALASGLNRQPPLIPVEHLIDDLVGSMLSRATSTRAMALRPEAAESLGPTH